MTGPGYLTCRTCRSCVRSLDVWACMHSSLPVDPGGSCGRYRPGCCESCRSLSLGEGGATCSATGEPTDRLSVCCLYDPCGRGSF
ncbi:MAG: hypothetical protein LBG62_03625 [Candidatus Methanoplasma sp.]|jgi:hypothetical protein|nr:hypothetical protein [Candidatus Methanoplasma sp.]